MLIHKVFDMKCPHCGQEHPDNFQFCPVTGKNIEVIKESTSELIACTNPSCDDYGKKILPADSRFCPTCGYKLFSENKTEDGEIFLVHQTEYGDSVVVYNWRGEEAIKITSKEKAYVHIEEDNNHKIAYICSDRQDIICVSHFGIRTISHEEYDILMGDPEIFEEKHPEYVSVTKLGVSSKGIPIFICYGHHNVETESTYFADVLTANGEKLFTTGKYSCIGLVGKTDKILITSIDCNFYFRNIKGEGEEVNLIDLNGRKLLNSDLKVTSNRLGDVLDKDSSIGIIDACRCIDSWESTRYNVITNTEVSFCNDYIYLSPIDEDKMIYKVYSARDNKIVNENIQLLMANFEQLAGGFTLIYTSYDYESLLGSDGQLVNLKPREHVLNYYIAQAIGCNDFYCKPEQYMVSNNRIITSIHNDDTLEADNILYYRILDYYGHEIRKIPSSKIVIKREYYNKKALFLKNEKKYRSVGFLDECGFEHIIPYKLKKYDEWNREIKIEDVDCEFVSDSVILINNEYRRNVVIDLQGNIILKTDNLLFRLIDGFFFEKLYNKDSIRLYTANGKFLFEDNNEYKIKVIM